MCRELSFEINRSSKLTGTSKRKGIIVTSGQFKFECFNYYLYLPDLVRFAFVSVLVEFVKQDSSLSVRNGKGRKE